MSAARVFGSRGELIVEQTFVLVAQNHTNWASEAEKQANTGAKTSPLAAEITTTTTTTRLANQQAFIPLAQHCTLMVALARLDGDNNGGGDTHKKQVRIAGF